MWQQQGNEFQATTLIKISKANTHGNDVKRKRIKGLEAKIKKYVYYNALRFMNNTPTFVRRLRSSCKCSIQKIK